VSWEAVGGGADLTNGPRQLQDAADPAPARGRWASSWGARAGRRARLGVGPGKGQWAAGRPGGKRARDSWTGGQRAAGPSCTRLEGLRRTTGRERGGGMAGPRLG
jgi:hypothetical protein